ncbi:MAG TPA: choice-of-anchor D domain-containing protein, partial [Candidatus Solibacter sp.]|nr:choice-of-anchor D domain-containing protein [Candidatus Solibacter sp.]
MSLTFASQNVLTTSAAQTVTLQNTGASALSIVSIVASGDYSQTNTCGTSIAAAASCIVTITFKPSAAGTRAGFITFSDNDPSNLQTVTLTGTGAAPSTTVSISPSQASVTPLQGVQFNGSISGVSSPNVTWAVDGVTGGNSTVGTITTVGLYTGASIAGAHTVTATSTANTTQSATVPVIVTA